MQFAHKTDAYLKNVNIPIRDNSSTAKHFKQTSVWIQCLSQNIEITTHNDSPVKTRLCLHFWWNVSRHSISCGVVHSDAAVAAADSVAASLNLR